MRIQSPDPDSGSRPDSPWRSSATYNSRVHFDDFPTPTSSMMQNADSSPKNAIVAMCLSNVQHHFPPITLQQRKLIKNKSSPHSFRSTLHTYFLVTFDTNAVMLIFLHFYAIKRLIFFGIA